MKGQRVIRELVHDEAVLSVTCEPATAQDIEVAQDLIDTIASMQDAGCLAANQIGVCKAVVAYLDEADQPHVLYNPRILLGLLPFHASETCLTREGEQAVKRFAKIKVSYDELVDGKLRTRRRDFTGWEAQMIQHMVDHCAGKLI